MDQNKKEKKINKMNKKIYELKQEFEHTKTISQKEILRENKLKEIEDFKALHGHAYYDNLIYVTQDYYDVETLEMELEFVETKEQNDIWQYLRIHTSSICGSQPAGRIIKLFVKEKKTHKYLGLIGLSGDIRAMKERDNYIGWDTETRNKRLMCISNMYCCIGLRPMSFNLNIGKLLAQIPFSKEVQEYYKDKYQHYVAGFITTSIDGKSVQYNDIKAINFIGYTQGFGTVHIPDELYKKGKELLAKFDKFNEEDGIKFEHSKKVYKGRYPKLQRILKMIGLNKSYLKHDNKRGIYFGFTGDDSQSFLQGKSKTFTPNLQSLDEIVYEWREKNAIKRFHSLILRSKLLIDTELNWFVKKYQSLESSKKYIEKKKEEIGDEEYKKEKREYMKQYRIDDENTKFTILEIDGNFDKMIDEEYKDFKLSNSYLAGFFDGDGSVYVGKDLILAISFDQDWFPILQKIQKKYGGMYGPARKKNKNSKPTYPIRITGQSCKKILEDLKDHCIVKKEMILVALKYFDTINKYNSKDEKKALRKQLADMKTNIKNYTNIDLTRLNDNYVAGLFDAEGLVYAKPKTGTKIVISKEPKIIEKEIASFRLQITQSSCPTLIYAFVNHYKCGQATSKYNNNIIDDWRITRSDEMKKITEILLPLVFKKKIQLQAYQKLLTTVGNVNNRIPYTINVHNIRKACAKIIDDEHNLCWKMNKKVFATKNHNQKKLNKLNCAKIQQEKKITKQERGRERINCEYCGNEISRNALKRHLNENCKKNPNTKQVENKKKLDIANIKSMNDLLKHTKTTNLGNVKFTKDDFDNFKELNKIISDYKKAVTNGYTKRKYTDDDMRDMKKMFKGGYSKAQIAKEYGIDRNTSAEIIEGKKIPFDEMDVDIDEYFFMKVIDKRLGKN